MKKIFLTLCVMLAGAAMNAQTDVTEKYIQNPDFGARFAGWINNGSFTFNTATSFEKSNGEVWMEKWVSSGNTLGSNSGMFQTLRNLPVGTYTLVAAARNMQQSNTSKVCTGAYIYAGDEQTEFNVADDYRVTFTVLNGSTNVGVKLTSCTGNWVCIDNFRLYYNETLNTDSINLEMQKLIDEAQSVLGDGATASELQSAITSAQAQLGSTDASAIQTAAVALERATLNYRISNPTTSNTLKVTTNPYLATGCTMALGRSTISGNAKEKGFCWSTEPNPTVLDNRTTVYLSNNGNIYRLEGLQPATVYYVRAYAINAGYQVAYGDVVKIATLPQGTVTYSYDYAGDDQQNARINSGIAETVWMYNQLANIRGFGLSVHYVYGAGAGSGTADCSYGGWMRVSQSSSYEQTGTMLHETNHGVGVGTTNEWYNNANLRSNTSSGKWLGPRATKMVQFLENNDAAYMQGDGTHMWAGTTSGTLNYGYGINGSNEDSYQPSNQMLYFGNILITHAMHQDGLVCSSSVGFATPAYVFSQDDNTKYYITCEDAECGGQTCYLGMTSTGVLKSYQVSAAEAQANDDYAWNITYDPKTSYYIFYNVGQQKYITNNNSTIKGAKKTSVSATEKFHLMPARSDLSFGDYTGTSYWMLTSSGHYALEGGTTFTSSTSSYATKTSSFDASNGATAQRWMFLTADQMNVVEAASIQEKSKELLDLIANIRKVEATPHVSRTEDTSVESIDAALEDVLTAAESADDYASTTAMAQHISDVQTAFQNFLAAATPASVAEPFDLTFLITNPGFDTDASGWSTTTTCSYSCCEFFEKTFDFNQATAMKLPAGTYEVRAQAYQRPGAYADVYTDYVTGGTNNVNASLYVKTKTQKIKNIYDDAQTISQGTGSVAAATKCYIPNTMQGAAAFFKKGYYDNSVLTTTSTLATIKMGLKGTTGTSYWTCFDNFRLLCHGAYSTEDVTPVEAIDAEETGNEVYFDLSGRRVQNPRRGIYVCKGRKVLIK